MTLRACSQCRRHFADEVECPFCGAVAPPREPRQFSTARISRAAAFAGAALTGCYTTSPPPQQYEPPPPPPPHEHQQQQQPDFAKPPPPAARKSHIEGTITDGSGQPLSITVHLRAQERSQQPFHPRTVQSDANGRYVFVDVPPGAYTVYAGQGDPRRPPSQQQIQLKANDKRTVDLTVYPYVPSNLPTPYGAPPARTRIV